MAENEVASTIRELMALTGLKQTSLGRKIGVSQGTISKWLKGTQQPQLAEWNKVRLFALKDPKTRHLAIQEVDKEVFKLLLDDLVSSPLRKPPKIGGSR